MTSLSINQLDKLTCKAEQASRIIYPLQEIDISGAFYERIYRDGSIVNIASDHNWTQLYFEKLMNGEYTAEQVSEYSFAKPGFNLSALLPKDKLWLDAHHHFGHGNGITLIEDHPSFREVICFYSFTNNTAINDYYINNLDTIRDLKQYFLIESSALIQELERERLTSFYKAYTDQKHSPSQTKNLKLSNHSFTKQEKSSAYVLIQNKKTRLPLYLSPQRGKCFTYLVQGKSCKEIAKEMNLSVRTVEHYIAKLRHDLGCKSSKELIAVYGEQLYSV